MLSVLFACEIPFKLSINKNMLKLQYMYALLHVTIMLQLIYVCLSYKLFATC